MSVSPPTAPLPESDADMATNRCPECAEDCRHTRCSVSSDSTLMTAAARAHAQPTRATAPECLPAARVERISKRLHAAPWAPASHPSSRQSGTPG